MNRNNTAEVTTSSRGGNKPMLPAVLHLTLTKKWFDMIKSGEKKEEYREFKQYWIDRLCNKHQMSVIAGGDLRNNHSGQQLSYRHFDFVEFKNGYAKSAPTMLVECKGISVGKAHAEWAEGFGDDCFVISLGNVVKLGV